ncbi:hypothetical protein DMA11_00515 [Marinilabiliaceae bacterium JC017]|nr:hypothetical protein DMA11_00515 [Marinilabiliaceae bacterium JC017]
MRDKSLSQQIVFHIQFWLGYITFFSFMISLEGDFPFSFYWVHFFSNIPALMVLAYPVVYYIYPRLMRKKQMALMIALAVAISFAASVAKLFTTYHLFYGLYLPEELAPENWLTLKAVMRNLFWVWVPTGLLLTIRFYGEWLVLNQEKSEMVRHRLEAELKMLKSQLNPHFLFNVLNNLYSLAIQKSDKTPDIIARLSALFEYMLYQGNKSDVSLREEVELIEAYIDLQAMKYGDRLNMKLSYDSELLNERIAPLILFPFIENCYKHGCSQDAGKPWIKIEITGEKGAIHMMAENSIPEKTPGTKSLPGGLGMVNTKKRLEILYPERHHLAIQAEEKSYRVQLQVEGKPVRESQMENKELMKVLN